VEKPVMVELTLVIAVLNIALGFALALYLGYGPSGWRDVCRDWVVAGWSRIRLRRDTSSPSLPTAGELSSDKSPRGEMQTGASGEALESDATLKSSDEPDDEDLMKLLNPDGPEEWDESESSVGTGA
jgi:hypothetical protein